MDVKASRLLHIQSFGIRAYNFADISKTGGGIELKFAGLVGQP